MEKGRVVAKESNGWYTIRVDGQDHSYQCCPTVDLKVGAIVYGLVLEEGVFEVLDE